LQFKPKAKFLHSIAVIMNYKTLLAVSILSLFPVITAHTQVAVTGVVLSHEDIYMNPGTTYQLAAQVQPLTATDNTITWSTLTGTIATVNNGAVTALVSGSEQIVVTTLDGSFTDTCTVHVVDHPLYAVEAESYTSTGGLLSNTTWGGTGYGVNVSSYGINYVNNGDSVMYSFSLPESGIYQLIYSISTPSDQAEIKAYIDHRLVSTDPVTNNRKWDSYYSLLSGETTGCEAGPHTLSLYASGTNPWQWNLDRIQFLKTANLTIPVESIQLTPEQVTLQLGQNTSLSHSILPANATNQQVSFRSENPAVANVTNLGAVSAISVGSALVVVATSDGGFSDTSRITVTGIPVSGISVTPSTDTLILGQTLVLTASLSPINATDDTIVWHSVNPLKASVSQTGLVTAIDTGWVSIVATSHDGNYPDSSRIYIQRIAVETLQVTPDSLSLRLGDQADLTAVLLPANATNKQYTWRSDSPEIASVNSSGQVNALSLGLAHLIATATDGGLSDSCTVTVTGIPVDSVRVLPESDTLKIGASLILRATVYPANASNPTVSWQSSNLNVARIDTNGKVSALQAGTATIVVHTSDGNHTDTTRLLIVPVAVESLELLPARLTLHVGDTQTIQAVVLPDTATNRNLSWRSTQIAVATVSQTGRVTALTEGLTSVIATTQDGHFTDTVRLTVERIPVQSVSISPNQSTLLIGDQLRFEAIVTPSNATYPGVLWASDNNACIQIDQLGNVRALAEGTCTLRVTTTDGGFTASASITVHPIHVNSISLSPGELVLQIGEETNLTAIINPQNATNPNYSWFSENTSIAHVDNLGRVSAITLGETYVVVTTEDGSLTDTTFITVTGIQVIGINLEPDVLNLLDGDTYNLTAGILPVNASDQRILWSVDSSQIALVTDNGQVTATGVGQAIVKATSRDGHFSDSTQVIVSARPVDNVRVFPSFYSLKIGDTIRLTARITPANATNRLVSWETQAPSIASITSDGLLTGLAVGNTVIQVTTLDGGFSASSTIQVVNTNAINLFEGSRLKLFPNPASQSITLNGLLAKTQTLRIITAQGALVFSETVDDKTEFTIAINQLRSGWYILVVQSEDELHHLPFSKTEP